MWTGIWCTVSIWVRWQPRAFSTCRFRVPKYSGGRERGRGIRRRPPPPPPPPPIGRSISDGASHRAFGAGLPASPHHRPPEPTPPREAAPDTARLRETQALLLPLPPARRGSSSSSSSLRPPSARFLLLLPRTGGGAAPQGVPPHPPRPGPLQGRAPPGARQRQGPTPEAQAGRGRGALPRAHRCQLRRAHRPAGQAGRPQARPHRGVRRLLRCFPARLHPGAVQCSATPLFLFFFQSAFPPHLHSPPEDAFS